MKRLLLTIFIFSTLVYVTVCTESIKDPEDGYFKGRVVDTSGNPIDSVRVATFPPHMRTYTNSNGYFTLRAFPRSYRLDLRKGKIFVSRVETTGGVVDTVQIGIIATQTRDTIYMSVDTVGGTVIETTVVRTVIDSSFYKSVSTDSVDLQPGQTFDFGNITMDTARIYIETVDTTVDTL
jgi:hypothetical protein